MLTVAMETMHFFILQKSYSLRTTRFFFFFFFFFFLFFVFCISGDIMNDLAPMKNCPGSGARKVKLAPGVYESMYKFHHLIRE